MSFLFYMYEPVKYEPDTFPNLSLARRFPSGKKVYQSDTVLFWNIQCIRGFNSHVVKVDFFPKKILADWKFVMSRK